MKKIIFLLGLYCPLFGSAQDTGVQFEQGLNWQGVLQKAKQEKKDIFIDCYATWCGPCKQMDKKVYPKGNVGDYMNSHFISIKLQVDSTKIDDEFVQEWYADARNIISKYHVYQFPTYLFFSPDGKIVHRFSGAVPDSLFMRIASNALDPDRQYYTRVEKYTFGKMEYADILKLAYAAKANGDKEFANIVAKDFLKNYLDKLNKGDLYTEQNIDFIRSFNDILTSEDKVFHILYQAGREKDEIVKFKAFSQAVVISIITREIIDPQIWPGYKAITGTPDWQKLKALVKKKYSRGYTERAVLNAQLRWYNEKKDWSQITKYTVEKIRKVGVDTTGILGRLNTNNIMFLVIFQHSSKYYELNIAIKVMERLINAEPDQLRLPDYIDTYANLLYKTGRTRKALYWEAKAVQNSQNKEIEQTFEKMTRREPTWK